ncbi:hypothetical protein DSO57_1023896 [Entomophthora muscae]|uniref:Uncharacterized protein n=1 Tax=Entomophthora muscae TaxID=34485 RepID=A0ACC2TQB6_9FUNG|nr:hypothetical protein DSO57_1023896 [Entomophthora muscae]
MYPVRGDEDPLVTLIPASQVILPLSPPQNPGHPPPTQVVGLCSLVPPQQDILLALPGTLLHDVLLARSSSPDSMVFLSKLTPEHPKEGTYTLKESIVYQKQANLGPYELVCACHDRASQSPLFGHPGTNKILELIRCTYSWVGITKTIGPLIK